MSLTYLNLIKLLLQQKSYFFSPMQSKIVKRGRERMMGRVRRGEKER